MKLKTKSVLILTKKRLKNMNEIGNKQRWAERNLKHKAQITQLAQLRKLRFYIFLETLRTLRCALD